MINVCTRNNLQALLDEPPGRAVSIFMPMQQGWPDLQQNQIRLKTLLRQAEEQLVELGIDPSTTDTSLDSAYPLLDDDGFWRQQSHGLASFTPVWGHMEAREHAPRSSMVRVITLIPNPRRYSATEEVGVVLSTASARRQS